MAKQHFFDGKIAKKIITEAYLIVPTRARRGHFVLQGGSSHSNSNKNFLYKKKTKTKHQV